VLHISYLDHLVLTVHDIDATCDFYTRVLGMEVRTFGENNARRALHYGNQKINLHRADHEFEPKAAHPVPGSADLCFLTEAAPEHVLAHLHAAGVTVIDGPVRRTGAAGPITSVYFRDPDDNLIEIGTRAFDADAPTRDNLT